MNMDRDRETDINFDFLRGVIMGAAGCILVLLSALTRLRWFIRVLYPC